MTNRISRLKTALFANTREISLERALLYTASHRQTEGEPKYRLLGKTWSMKEVPAPSSADVATMREMAERAGLQVTVGG
ncbi:hypothetical protein AB146_002756 [Escherichia coli]|nr:hypothetical protein [Escherichia coli]EGG9790530.1 hypothetical protein [Escherichia coli]TJT26375.1 hypothetical protein C9Z05_15010 [Escherichia coli]HBA3018998.1 hypothetical protein [Escherichia coli]